MERGHVFNMGRKAKIDYQTRIEIVRKRNKQGISIRNLARMYGCNESVIKRFLLLYRAHGETGLALKGNRNSAYTYDFKMQVVNTFLSGKSINGVAIQFKLAKKLVSNWIKKYNSNQLKEYIPKGEIYTMASKKYSKAEKEAIILECIQSNKDYKMVCSKYSIRYNNLYQWVRIYEKNEKLKPLKLAKTNEEKLEILLKLKEIENQALRDELEILKKNEEIYQKIQSKRSRRNV